MALLVAVGVARVMDAPPIPVMLGLVVIGQPQTRLCGLVGGLGLCRAWVKLRPGSRDEGTWHVSRASTSCSRSRLHRRPKHKTASRPSQAALPHALLCHLAQPQLYALEVPRVLAACWGWSTWEKTRMIWEPFNYMLHSEESQQFVSSWHPRRFPSCQKSGPVARLRRLQMHRGAFPWSTEVHDTK